MPEVNLPAEIKAYGYDPVEATARNLQAIEDILCEKSNWDPDLNGDARAQSNAKLRKYRAQDLISCRVKYQQVVNPILQRVAEDREMGKLSTKELLEKARELGITASKLETVDPTMLKPQVIDVESRPG